MGLRPALGVFPARLTPPLLSTTKPFMHRDQLRHPLPAGLIVRDHDIMYSHFVAPSRCQTVFVARASAMLVTQPPAHELATNSFDFAPRVLNLRACLSRQPLARPHLIVWRGRAGRET